MISSKILSQYKEIIHGVTTRQDGDAELWLKKNQSIADNLVLANQIHEDNIIYVTNKDKGKIIKETDGLITKEKKVILGIRTADCVPVLFYEPIKKIIASVHAGWRGTLQKISQKMVKEIVKLGGKKENIISFVGPHIGMCCYNIEESRASLFRKEFGDDPRIIARFEDGVHLDLGFVNFSQLIQAGLKQENIEAPIFCTSCDKNRFFSYRRKIKNNDKYGEMLSYIGIV